MNLSVVTIEDCLDMYYKKGFSSVLEDGNLIGFLGEEVNDSGNLRVLWGEL